ncbi:MAG: hypothetical protein AB7G13_19300 [Lautropia sp.]
MIHPTAIDDPTSEVRMTDGSVPPTLADAPLAGPAASAGARAGRRHGGSIAGHRAGSLAAAGLFALALAGCGSGAVESTAVSSMADKAAPAMRTEAADTAADATTASDEAAAADRATVSDAVTASDAAATAITAAEAVDKLPTIRPGIEAPLDRADEGDKLAGIVAGLLRFRSGFEGNVALGRPSGPRAGLIALSGGDGNGFTFPLRLWSATEGAGTRIVSSVRADGTDLPVTDFLTASLRTVTGRDGTATRALSLDSHHVSGGRQQIAVEQAQLGTEPVMYQRMWVKFDTSALARASQVGPWQYYLQFWEATASDFRLRLKLRYDGNGNLYWFVKADPMDERQVLWQADLRTVPVTLAAADRRDGWHKVEIWLDRPGSRFVVAIDGTKLVDRRTQITGARGASIDTLRPMMVTSETAPRAEVLFDDFEIWAQPPADASAR